MENKKFNTGLEQIKKISMTDIEKSQMLEHIKSTPLLIQEPVKSNWVNPFMLNMRRHRLVYFMVVSCLVLVLSGKEIVYASQESLPGDALYKVKVNIVEPARTALKFSSVAKAEYASSLATKRLVEAEVLASENKLDESKQRQISALLENHTNSLNKKLSKIKKGGSDDEVDNIVINFEAGMNAHAKALEIISEDGEDKSGKDHDSKIIKTARDNSAKLRDDFKGKDEDKSKYNRRKDAVRSLIDSTTNDINNASTETSDIKKKVINNANQTIIEANKFLKKADDDKDEDADDAYSSLLDSESRAKEAKIFLKTGLDIEEKKNSNDEKGRRGKDREESNHNKNILGL